MAAEAFAEAFAPAKINLTLHVTGRRGDGYHDLDSLVVFVGVGDHLQATPAADLLLAIKGPMAAGLAPGEENLVLRAARFLDVGGARLVLTKRLPVASGIGGGSSDAAAAVRALCALAGRALPAAADLAVLGADVPVCLTPVPQRIRGRGERLEPVAGLPPAWLVLVNPGVPVATPAVFAALDRRDNPPMPVVLPAWADAAALAAFLRGQRNDLEAPAQVVAPVIGEVIAALATQEGCLVARMSGSGATAFGLFAARGGAEAAAARLARAEPGWWVAAAPVLAG